MSRTTSETTRDSGMAFRMLVRACGAIGLGAFFLPFFNSHSGFEVAQKVGNGEMSPASVLTAFSTGPNFSGSNPGAWATIIGVFFLVGMVLFTIISLFMLISGKYAGAPLTLLLIFNVAAWILLQFGDEHNAMEGLLGHANYGYWVSVGALFTPFAGMFFLDKSV